MWLEFRRVVFRSRALKDVKVPLLYSILSYYFVCLPLGYFIGHTLNMGPIGIWVGLMLGLVFASILFTYRFNKITTRYIQGKES